jgi:flagellar basal body-associated protein FliL
MTTGNDNNTPATPANNNPAPAAATPAAPMNNVAAKVAAEEKRRGMPLWLTIVVAMVGFIAGRAFASYLGDRFGEAYVNKVKQYNDSESQKIVERVGEVTSDLRDTVESAREVKAMLEAGPVTLEVINDNAQEAVAMAKRMVGRV